MIFISPLLSESIDEFHQSRTQCIGRACRYGQTKKVYIWDILALSTIDVDITEEQRCKRLIKESSPNGEDVWQLKSEEDLDDDEKAQTWGSGWERKSLYEQ